MSIIFSNLEDFLVMAKSEPVPWDDIEPYIIEPVKQLQGFANFQPIYSCQGHPKGDPDHDSWGNYIIFRCNERGSEELAALYMDLYNAVWEVDSFLGYYVKLEIFFLSVTEAEFQIPHIRLLIESYPEDTENLEALESIWLTAIAKFKERKCYQLA